MQFSPKVILWHLSFIQFDHCRISLVLNSDSARSKYSSSRRYERWWMQVNDFKDLMATKWNSVVASSSSSTCGHRNAISFLTNIHNWALKAPDNYCCKFHPLWNLLTNAIFNQQDTMKIQADFEAAIHQQELYWQERAQTEWLQAVDRNTRFSMLKPLSEDKESTLNPCKIRMKNGMSKIQHCDISCFNTFKIFSLLPLLINLC